MLGLNGQHQDVDRTPVEESINMTEDKMEKVRPDSSIRLIHCSYTSMQVLNTIFCSAFWPTSIRGLATRWTYFLHLSLFSVILIDSSTGSPVHVLMLSIQTEHGLPHLPAPDIVPCIISFSSQLLVSSWCDHSMLASFN